MSLVLIVLLSALFAHTSFAATNTPGIAAAAAPGLKGEYFNGTSLQGSPVLTRTDAQVNFNWSLGSPAPAIPADNFSARWTGVLVPPVTGTYRLGVAGDDGFRLWVDGVLVVDDWNARASVFRAAPSATLTGGKAYSIKLEYFESAVHASVGLYWSVNGSADVAIPSTALLTEAPATNIAAPPPGTPGLWGQFFGGIALQGNPIHARVDSNVFFNWGYAGPGSPVPVDNFSARWTGVLIPQTTGTYRLGVAGDDGFRLWVDGALVVDDWNIRASVYRAGPTVTLTAGRAYAIKLEYFENDRDASVGLFWSVNGAAEVPIPGNVLYTSAPATTTPPTPPPPTTPPPTTPPPAPPGTTVTGIGLRGDYYANTEFTGLPLLARTDATVNFNWYEGRPASGMPVDQFAIRWTGYVVPATSGNYVLRMRTDDGVRLWLDDKLVLENWAQRSAVDTDSTSMALTAGKRYKIRIDYFEGVGTASAKFSWSLNGKAFEVVPQAVLQVPDGATWLSDVTPLSMSSGWGPVEKDESNGEQAQGDGRTLQIGSLKFAKGLGVHAASEIVYNLAGKYSVFEAVVGVDEESEANGSVEFEVYVDDLLAFDSGKMTGSGGAKYARINVSGKQKLRLVVTDAGDGIGYDHADWADAKLTVVEANMLPPPPLPKAPVVPTGVTATAGEELVTLRWTGISDATGYKVYRGVTSGGQGPDPVATVTSAATSYVDRGLTAGTTYYYKISAFNTGGESAKSSQVSARPTVVIQPPQPVEPATTNAVRFLRQATWGPTDASIQRFKDIGVDRFLDEQFAAPAATYPAALTANDSVEPLQEHFFRLALTGEDQLRQRVAFALSQIFVVSAVEVDCSEAMVPYVKLLSDNAFGNFYDVMSKVTLNVAMGEYLDMLNNGKANPTTGDEPNENFARELLQLFTIGLTELNPDGTPRTNPNGQQIPTYGQSDVMGLARALTGWTFSDGTATAPTRFRTDGRYDLPMVPVAARHDTGSKSFLGYTLPAGQSPQNDLEQSLRIIFNHPNVGPFVSKQLIQHLVTSNPSPRYIGDVAAVFANNGQGVRGDLRAVVRAILKHPEASAGGAVKLQEPALFINAVLRGLGATVADHPFMSDFSQEMAQRVYYSPSVFNYYSPNFRPVGGGGLLGPEFQIYNSALALIRTNFLKRLLTNGFGSDVTINWTAWDALSAQPELLIDKASNLFMGGTMPAQMRAEIRTALVPITNARERSQTVLYLTLASPQYQVEH